MVDRRPVVEQSRRQLIVAVVDRQPQRILPVTGRCIDIGARCQQVTCGRHVALPCSKKQRSEPPVRISDGRGVWLRICWLWPFATTGVGHRINLRTGVEIGTVANERLDCRRVVLGHRPHQSGRPPPRLLRVYVGPMVQQQLDGAHFSGAGRHHEGCIAVRGQRRVRVDAGREESLNHGDAAIDGGELHRRSAGMVGGRYVGAGLDKQPCRVDVVTPDGPMQGRRAIDLRRVDGSASLQQRLNCRPTVDRAKVGT